MDVGTLAWPLDRAARHRPDQEALVDGDLRLDWRGVHDRACRLGGGFKELGLAVGDRVAILSANSAPCLEMSLALPRFGLVNSFILKSELPAQARPSSN